MHLAQLRWLEGFGADGRWHVVGSAPVEVAVDGLKLAHARRIVNTLQREHGGALDALVGGAAPWLAAIDGLLRYLGQWARGGPATDAIAGLVPSRTRRASLALAAEHPRLRPLVAAATSAWVLRPDMLADTIGWDEAPRRERADAAGVDALLSLALTDVGDGAQTFTRLASLAARLRGSGKAEAPVPARSGATALAWIDRLHAQAGGERARDRAPRACRSRRGARTHARLGAFVVAESTSVRFRAYILV